MLRKILLTIAALSLLLLAIGGVFVYRTMSRLDQDSRAILQKLSPRIVAGEGLLSKRVFYAVDDGQQFWQVLVGWPADRNSAQVAAISSDGVSFLDDGGREQKFLRFSERASSTI
jgi:hypothetical protein